LYLTQKEDELNRMRVALDGTNYHTTTKKSIPDRTKSAPHFDGISRKVNDDLNVFIEIVM
jgi:hypothetical protein